MACQIRNIADFSGNSHQGRPMRRGRARIYQFPASPGRAPLPGLSEQDLSESSDDSSPNPCLILGIEAAAALFFYGVWFLWHMHR
jgi:hypothetical protein